MKLKRKSKIKSTTGEMIFDTFNVIFMLMVISIMILPMIHVLSVSLSSGPASITGGFFFWPRGGINFSGYQTVFGDPLLMRSYFNSIVYAVGGVLCTLFFTALTAYPMSVPGFVLNKFLTIFLTITMFIGGGMIPTYLVIRDLHLINSMWVMIVPFCIGAYNVILFRTFFNGIPSSLREAAVIDGASEFTIFLKMYIPLSKAILATIGLFTLVGKWNDWFTALLYLNDETKYPVQMILRKILFNTSSMENKDNATFMLISNLKVTGENIKMAAIIITLVPILCVYPFLQKYFVKGVFVGTIKG